jgi:hypothetical protein
VKGASSFAGLTPAQQDELLHDVEQTPFFQAARFDTIVGAFALPTWGGNRDYAGWRLLGFEHQMRFEAPFGYYDAEANRRGWRMGQERQGARFQPSDTVDFVSSDRGPAASSPRFDGGFSVVMLEQGPRLTRRSSNTTSSRVHAGALANNMARSRRPSGHGERPGAKAWTLVYGRLVGGSNAHFTANFWRLRPGISTRPVCLAACPARGVDWPITYDELEPYTRSRVGLGVSACRVHSIRRARLSMPPLPVKSSGCCSSAGRWRSGCTRNRRPWRSTRRPTTAGRLPALRVLHVLHVRVRAKSRRW